MVTYDDSPDEYSDRVIEGNRSKSGWGSQGYKDLNKSASCQYLKDDCLFFQITKL